MGMSTSVIGLKEKDDHYNKMEAAYKACWDAGVEPPLEVSTFFKDCDPKYGHAHDAEISAAVTEWTDDMQMIYEVDLNKLPPGVKKIRFTNSW